MQAPTTLATTWNGRQVRCAVSGGAGRGGANAVERDRAVRRASSTKEGALGRSTGTRSTQYSHTVLPQAEVIYSII